MVRTNKMQIYDYETKFVAGVNKTYAMLGDLNEVQNDEEFWKVYDGIKVGFDELESARRGYYAILVNDGADTEDCSLTQELRNGLYFLDEKYVAILEKIEEISAFWDSLSPV